MATILIVDDLSANRKALVTLLGHQDHELFEAADGRIVMSEIDRDHLRLLTDQLWEKDEDLRTATLRSRALINIALELVSERDSDRRLQSVCWSVCDLFSATYVTLGLVDPDNHTLQDLISCGADAANWIEPGDTVSGVLGEVVAGGRTMRGDTRVGDPAGLQFPALHPEVQAYLAVPIASLAHIHGWLCLVGNEGRSFTEDDEQLVKALAGQVGRIYELEHEIAVRKRAEAAVREERDRAQQYLNTAEVMLVAIDQSGRITLAESLRVLRPRLDG